MRRALLLLVVSLPAAAADGGVCAPASDPEVVRLSNESFQRNEAQRKAALADAGLTEVRLRRTLGECGARDRARPGEVLELDGRRYLAGEREFGARPAPGEGLVTVMKDAKGVLHLTTLEPVDERRPVPLVVCAPCPTQSCWGSGVPPCEQQVRYGPLEPSMRVGERRVVRWAREQLAWEVVAPQCAPPEPCPAYPSAPPPRR